MVVLKAKTRYARCLDGGKNLKKREEKCDHYEEVKQLTLAGLDYQGFTSVPHLE